MAIENPDSTVQQMLGSMFLGTAISFVLHGVTCCQMIWFFRNQSGRSSKSMIAFVIFVWLMEALNCTFMFLATLNMFLLPAVTYASKDISPCSDWIARAQSIPDTLVSLSVEGFFIMRVWRFSEHKKLTMLLFIPYVASYVFAFAQMGRSFQLRCNPGASDLNPVFVYGSNGSRIFLDGVVAVSMCYMLYSRSSGFTRHTNTIKIVRGLILWSISTGVLMWIISLLFLLSIPGLIPSAFAVFYITGGVYANAMLAQLNARERFRAMAEASMPLSTISLGESSSSQRGDRELQPLDPV